MPTYQPNVPSGTVPFNQDYLNLQGNFQQLNIAYGVDHVPFSDTSGIPPAGITGMHTSIHLVPVSTVATNPPTNQPINGYTAVSGYGQIFDAQIYDGINTDEALFYLSGGNRLMQMTRNFVPVALKNGYIFLPGGLILQWGIVNGTHGSDNHFNGGDHDTVTFSTANINFPANIFSVWTQPNYTAGNAPQSSNAATVSVQSNFTTTEFMWTILSSSGSYTSFLWFALGN